VGVDERINIKIDNEKIGFDDVGCINLVHGRVL
jgi:hypothetical protein